MAVRHALTSFRRGANLAEPADGAGKLPVPMFGGVGQGWKVYYEDFLNFSGYAPTQVDLTDSTTGTPSDTLPDDGTAITAGEHKIAVASLARKINEGMWNNTVESTGLIQLGINGVSLEPQNTTDNSSAMLQSATPALLMGANTKRFYMETSFTMNINNSGDIDQGEFFIGFTSDQQTTNFVASGGGSWAFDDGFGFGRLDGDTTMSFVARQSDVEQLVTSTATFTDEVRATFGLYYDGITYFMYKDGIELGQAARTVYNDDAAMGLTLYTKNGEAFEHDLLVNYLMLAVEL